MISTATGQSTTRQSSSHGRLRRRRWRPQNCRGSHKGSPHPFDIVGGVATSLFFLVLIERAFAFPQSTTATATEIGSFKVIRDRHYRRGDILDASLTKYSHASTFKGLDRPKRLRRDLLQDEVDFPNGGESDAFLECYDTLKSVANGVDEVGQDEYLEFLEVISNEDLVFDSFAQLPALFLMIFYASACPTNTDCLNEIPTIALDPQTPEELDGLKFCCDQIMIHTYTRVSVRFGYNVRYNSSTIVDDEDLQTCLEDATESLLLDQLGGCTAPHGRRLRMNIAEEEEEKEDSHVQQPHHEMMERLLPNESETRGSDRRHSRRREHEQQQRMLPQASSNDDPSYDDSCPYDVLVQVFRMNETPCDPPQTESDTRCLQISSSATVRAQQIVDPDEDTLETKVIDILAQAIDDDEGGFEAYLPDGCLLGTE